MDDAQSLQRQEFIHIADGGTFRRHQRGQPSGGNDFGMNPIFLLDTLNNAVHKTDITEKDSGLNGIDGIFPYYLFGLDDLDPRQLRSPLKESLQRDQQAGRNR